MKKLVSKFQESLQISKKEAVKRIIFFFFFGVCILATISTALVIFPYSCENNVNAITKLVFLNTILPLVISRIFLWCMLRCQKKLIYFKPDGLDAQWAYQVVWRIKDNLNWFFSLS